MPNSKKTAQFFIDDDSGEPWQLIGSAEDLDMTIENLNAHLSVALDQLLEDGDGGEATLRIKRKDMTEAEVAELPEV